MAIADGGGIGGSGDPPDSDPRSGGDTGGDGGGGEPSEASAVDRTVRVDELQDVRERAESAEQRADELEDQVRSLEGELVSAQQQLASLERRAEIDRELSRASAVDLETAGLLAELALHEMDEPDVSAAVAEMRRSKPYLFEGAGSFGGRAGMSGGSAMSVGADAETGTRRVLDSVADQARSSGDRRELLRYLRMKRSS